MILLLLNVVYIKPNYAITPNEVNDISGRWFYIKNAYTGKYLDVVNGITYAEDNWHNRILCYPDCSNIGGDCANFVSQCLLAAGVHRNSDWYMDKLNNVYQTPAKDTTQLDATIQQIHKLDH